MGSALKNQMFEVEVLQNGEPVGYYRKSATSTGVVRIGEGILSHIRIPKYRFDHPLDLFKIRRTGIEIDLRSDCDGFVTMKDNLIDIEEFRKTHKLLHVNCSAYGSLMVKDLQILFRVGKAKALRKDRTRVGGYGAGVLSLVFASPLEAQVAAASSGIALLVLSCFLTALYFIEPKVPSHFIELPNDVIISTFAPRNLETIPELMQEQLDRSNYLKSTHLYYRALTHMLTGWSEEPNKLMYRNSWDRYEGLHRLRVEAATIKLERQEELDRRQLAKPMSAMVRVPSVSSESLIASMKRIEAKVHAMHIAADELYKLRLEVTKEFPRDVKYDFGEYSTATTLEEKSEEALSKINTFDLLTNEQAMYFDTKALAAKAYLQNKNKAKDTKPSAAFASAAIFVPDGVHHISFAPAKHNRVDDVRIDQIIASEFGASAKQPVREPLVGEIEPQLVEQIIAKNRYELQLCYELALRRNRDLLGQAEFSWRIDTRGQVSDLSVLSTNIKDKTMLECVQKKIANWSFPRPRRGSVKVRYPFAFSRGRTALK